MIRTPLSKQKAIGTFTIPKWDPEIQTTVRMALLTLVKGMPDTSQAFGMKDQVDPVDHLVNAAAFYVNYTPPRNNGKTIYKLHVSEVPVDGFGAISVYNADGYFRKNELDGFG